MQKLTEVEEAKAVMLEAIDWSVIKWLREKKRVRKMADRANAALDATIEKMKAQWEKDMRAAYDQLGGPTKDATASPDIALTARKYKHAEDEARQARQVAEDMFDEAEKQLSTSLAREGCRKAIRSWELHEHVIKLAEAKTSAKA